MGRQPRMLKKLTSSFAFEFLSTTLATPSALSTSPSSLIHEFITDISPLSLRVYSAVVPFTHWSWKLLGMLAYFVPESGILF